MKARPFSLHWNELGKGIHLQIDPRFFHVLWIGVVSVLLGFAWLAWEILAAARIYPQLLYETRKAVSLQEKFAEVQQESEMARAQVLGMDSVAKRLLARYGLKETKQQLALQSYEQNVADLLFPEVSPEGQMADEIWILGELAQRRNRELQAATSIAQERIRKWEGTPSIAPVAGSFTSGFGWRLHPVLGRYMMHEGQDIGTPIGRPVRSTAAGIVSVAEYSSSYGNYVVVAHSGGVRTAYAHLSALRCRVGDRVRRGQLIGLSGNTGRSSGPHVHYEVRLGKTPVNPLRWILPVTLAP